MASLNVTAKKLQKAILQSGLVIKMNSSQFFSEEQRRMVTIFTLSTPALQQNKRGDWKTRDYEILRSASNIDIVLCLADIYKAVKEWRG